MENNGKIKVLQVLPEMEIGGVERGAHDLSIFSLKENKNDVSDLKNIEIITASNGGILADKLKEAGAKHIDLNLKTKNPLLIICNIFKLKKIIKNEKISIIHARSRAPAWSCYLASKISSAKFITTFHGFYKNNAPMKKSYNAVMSYGNKVISVSHFMKQHIINTHRTNENKIEVIHRGIDLQEFCDNSNMTEEKIESFKKAHVIPEDARIILLPGRITRWKGQDVAINALALLKEKYGKEAFLILVGSHQGRESYYNELIELKKTLNLQDHIIFTGNMNNMAVVYASADIVLNCSREPETFGRVTAEAGAMGKPVIATDIGGSKEIIIENVTGKLVKEDDPEALAKAMDEYLEMIENSKKLDELAKSTRKNIEENFSLKQMCVKTLNLYKRITY